MSYCRFGLESDIYLFKSVYGDLELWMDEETKRFNTAAEALDYLLILRKQGLLIPDYAIDRLTEEIEGKMENVATLV